ncbi:hypothetical protein CIHG_03350 [Coccidioides immitis H538.4]|uniref:Uncharacterized protein n=1 Tax=Coccidioides immitis H538.4 TaxID=396776 RepID=A0A0J8RLX0_COCIT|nr:hypothetical protein CIHG_03350 [Coccidioides immitis H538.4]
MFLCLKNSELYRREMQDTTLVLAWLPRREVGALEAGELMSDGNSQGRIQRKDELEFGVVETSFRRLELSSTKSNRIAVEPTGGAWLARVDSPYRTPTGMEVVSHQPSDSRSYSSETNLLNLAPRGSDVHRPSTLEYSRSAETPCESTTKLHSRAIEAILTGRGRQLELNLLFLKSSRLPPSSDSARR